MTSRRPPHGGGRGKRERNMTGMFHEHDFHDYEFVILDASYFLLRERGAELAERLSESRVYVPVTFEAERRAYRELLPDKRRASYDAFTRALSGYKTPDRPQSAWEMARSVSARGKSLCVVTGNRLFIERMILEDEAPLKADIFDLSRMEWILCEEFSQLRTKLEFQKEELSEVPPPKETIGYGTTLYKSDGEEIRLCKLGEGRMSGAESELYGVEDFSGENIGIAKIFRTGNLTPGKCRHLHQMTEAARRIEAPWAFFPTDTLYRDETRRIFAGILEDYAGESHTLYERRVYQGDLSSNEELSMRLSDNLRLCFNLVRQICFLNHYGFFVSDFNLKNFALSEEEPNPLSKGESNRVLMFDTDSFGFQNYFSGFHAAGSSTANVYDTTTKRGALGFCDDALYVSVFTLLSLGSPPIYVKEQARLFRFDEKPEDDFKRLLFPERLWRFFENAFRVRKSFSAEMLLWELSEALRDLDRRPEDNFEYGPKLEEIFKVKSPNQGGNAAPPAQMARLLKSGGLDHVLLFLTGFSILVVLYLLFQSGFFGASP